MFSVINLQINKVLNFIAAHKALAHMETSCNGELAQVLKRLQEITCCSSEAIEGFAQIRTKWTLAVIKATMEGLRSTAGMGTVSFGLFGFTLCFFGWRTPR